MPVGAIAGAGVLGAGASIFGASQQAGATQGATAAQQQAFQTLQQNLAPYNAAGQQSLSQLLGALPSLTATFNPTMQQLEQTPGYQFTLQQGMNAVNNSNSTKGWGDSGPGAKAIAQYTTGLASQTYNQQLQNYLAQNAQIYNMLMGPAQLGANAAAGVGSGAQTLGSQIGSNLIGGANALAGGASGAASQLGNAGISSALLPLLFQQLQGQGQGAGTSSGGGF